MKMVIDKNLPINDDGYVFHEGQLLIMQTMMNGILFNEDYPSTRLEKGKYLFVITNDIRYLETTLLNRIKCISFRLEIC